MIAILVPVGSAYQVETVIVKAKFLVTTPAMLVLVSVILFVTPETVTEGVPEIVGLEKEMPDGKLVAFKVPIFAPVMV